MSSMTDEVAKSIDKIDNIMTSELAKIADSSRLAQQKWSRQSIRSRLKIVRKVRSLLVERSAELADLVSEELGRSRNEVLATDLLPTVDACRFLERHAAKVLQERRVANSQRPLWLTGSHDTVYRRPRGVIGFIGTWNYPLFLNLVPILQAVTAGNSVLWKPSEWMPRLAEAISDIFRNSGFPDYLIQTLPEAREIGPQLLETSIDHLIFIGSAGVGRKIAARLGERLITSTLELSGHDAMIVCNSADPELAARAVWYGVMLNHGQTCVAVRRVLVQESIYPQFIEKLKALAQDRTPKTLLTRAQMIQADQQVQQAIAAGAEILNPANDFISNGDSASYPATILIHVNPGMSIMREALFAPICMVIPFREIADCLGVLRACPYQLSASVFSNQRHQIEAIAAQLKEGLVCGNDVIVPVAHPATPFGGSGDSGWGVTQGAEGLLELTVPQVVSLRSGSWRPHYDALIKPNDADGDLLLGMIQWSHAPTWRKKIRGLLQLIRAGRARFQRVDSVKKIR